MAVEALVNPERVKQSASLTPEEWKVFFLVDGRRSLGEICRPGGRRTTRPRCRSCTACCGRASCASLPIRRRPEAAERAPAKARAPRRCPAEAARSRPSGRVQPRPALRKVEDDTSEIVTRKAVQYMANASKVTVSRLVLVTDGTRDLVPAHPRHLHPGPPPQQRHRDHRPQGLLLPRAHRPQPRGFVLVDLKSRNGSFVNGKRIEAALLKTGDEVRLGTAQLVYKVDYTSAMGVSSVTFGRARDPAVSRNPLPRARRGAARVLAPPYDVIPPAYQDGAVRARPPQHRARGPEPHGGTKPATGRRGTPTGAGGRGPAGRRPGARALRARADVRRGGPDAGGASGCSRASARRTRARA